MDILITGSVANDYLMTFPGKFKEQILPDQLDSISLSFLVDRMVHHRGGIAPNISYTLALLGQKPRIFATVGQDFNEYRAFLDNQGVDTTWAKEIPDVFTASFFVTTDQDNNQLASFYPGAMAHAAELSLHELKENQPDLVVISPNDPDAMRQYIRESKELNIPFLFDPSQQVARMDGDFLKEGIDGALALFANEYEYSLILNKTGMTQDQILDQIGFMVITLGEKGASIFTDGKELKVEAVTPNQIIDPTGAGDAFRGGFLTGYAQGWDWELCGKLGSLTAVFCLESDGPQGQKYTPNDFVERFTQNFGENELLNKLIK